MQERYFVISLSELNRMLKAASNTGRDTLLDYPEDGLSGGMLDLLVQMGILKPYVNGATSET